MKPVKLFLAAGLIALMAGCAQDAGTGTSVPRSGDNSNPVQSLNRMAETGVVNLDEVNSMYAEQKAKASQGDPEAKVYCSVLGLFTVSNDPEMKNIIEAAGMTPDSININSLGRSRGGIAPSARVLPSVSGNIAMLKALPSTQSRLMRGLSEPDLSKLPKVSEVQDVIESKLLPLIDQGIAYLSDVSKKSSFTMEIAIDEDTIEVDQTEIRALLAAFYLARIYTVTLVSYNLDFDNNGSYEYLEGTDAEVAAVLIPLADQSNSSFLAIRSNHGTLLSGNKTTVLDAVTAARSAIEFLQSETDNQSNDIIPQDEFDYAEVYDVMDSVKNLFSGITNVKIYDRTIQIDARNLFDVPDFKNMLPYYEIYPFSQWELSPSTHTYQYCETYSYFNGTAYQTYENCYEERSQFPVKFLRSPGGTITVDGAVGMDDLDNKLDSSLIQLKDMADYIIFKDPTFNNTLPGMTNAALWDLIQYIDDEESKENWQPTAPEPPTYASAIISGPAAVLARIK